MTNQNETTGGAEESLAKANEFARMAAQSQGIVSDFIARQQSEGVLKSQGPFDVGQAFMEMTQQMLSDPARLVQAQLGLFEGYMKLWQHTASRMMGGEVGEPIVVPAPDDRRFRAADWSENHFYDFIKQSYLLTSNWFLSTVQKNSGELDEKSAQKLAFYTRQFVDAVSPTNFVMTNPTVLRETLDSGGENLVRGLANMLDDLERGGGNLDIRMTDQDAFEAGENLALTPGKVVFQNDLMQLIQYAPAGESVYTRPLLVIAPWINKYYVLDLKPENSFIGWAVAQGYTVFVISWVIRTNAFRTRVSRIICVKARWPRSTPSSRRAESNRWWRSAIVSAGRCCRRLWLIWRRKMTNGLPARPSLPPWSISRSRVSSASSSTRNSLLAWKR